MHVIDALYFVLATALCTGIGFGSWVSLGLIRTGQGELFSPKVRAYSTSVAALCLILVQFIPVGVFA